MKTAHKTQAGFTLVEVLVALFIFSLLSAATLTVLTSTLDGKAQMAKKNAHIKQIARARILLKSDLANTLAIAKVDEFGLPESIHFYGGMYEGALFLKLSRTGWDNPGGIERRSNLQTVEYSLENGSLTRRVRARHNAVNATPTYEQVLLKNLTSIKTSFFNEELWQDNWVTGLPPSGVQTLPQLASIEFEFEDNTSIRQIFYVGADQ